MLMSAITSQLCFLRVYDKHALHFLQLEIMCTFLDHAQPPRSSTQQRHIQRTTNRRPQGARTTHQTEKMENSLYHPHAYTRARRYH